VLAPVQSSRPHIRIPHGRGDCASKRIEGLIHRHAAEILGGRHAVVDSFENTTIPAFKHARNGLREVEGGRLRSGKRRRFPSLGDIDIETCAYGAEG
jgi:hypothetical protein